MELFFRDLVRKLDDERKNWRSDTLIVLDNAPYHTSQVTIDLFRNLSLPICFTGPHSYDACKYQAFLYQIDHLLNILIIVIAPI